MLVLSAACANASGVAFYDAIVVVERDIPDGADGTVLAVQAIVAGPTAGEAAARIVSAIPQGVAALSVRLDNAVLTVDLSPEVAEGLDDALLQSVFGQFKATFLNPPMSL